MFRFRFIVNPTTAKNFPKGRIYIHNQLKRLFRDCTREFVKAAVDSMVDDIDTGMSIASFEDLSTKLRMKTILKNQLHGKKTPVGGIYNAKSPAFSSGSGEQKTTVLGARLGQKAYQLEFGTPQNPQFLFTFQIVVLQFYLQSEGLAQHHWDALNKGREAFIAYWNNNLSRYVKSSELVDIIKTGRLSVLGENLNEG